MNNETEFRAAAASTDPDEVMAYLETTQADIANIRSQLEQEEIDRKRGYQWVVKAKSALRYKGHQCQVLQNRLRSIRLAAKPQGEVRPFPYFFMDIARKKLSLKQFYELLAEAKQEFDGQHQRTL